MKGSEAQRFKGSILDQRINLGSEDQSVDQSIDQSWIRGSEVERFKRFRVSEDQSVDQSVDQSWIRGSEAERLKGSKVQGNRI